MSPSPLIVPSEWIPNKVRCQQVALRRQRSASMISIPAILAFLAVLLCFVVRVLNRTDIKGLMPQTFDSNSEFIQAVKASCPFLRER